MNMHKFLGVIWGRFYLSIWESLCIIESSWIKAEGLSILQYADDTVIFMDNDLEKAKNTKLLLCAFEQLLGLKINFYKSELYCYGAAKANQNEYAQIFRCDLRNVFKRN
jgi:hypothetical protein